MGLGPNIQKGESMSVIQAAIDQYITSNSKFEEHRDYLGMSQLNKCPRILYTEFTLGSVADPLAHRMAYAGYEQEKCILDMLISCHVAQWSPRELVAPFDHRFRGHIDAETMDGDLLEFKSTSTHRWKKVIEDNRPLFSHAVQVQMYMLYGGYKRSFVVYRNRETYEHLVFEVKPDARMQHRYEEKAKIILAAIDKGKQPECECGRCKE